MGSEPEYRLIPAIPGSVLIPTGLFWFGWTVSLDIHWIVPIIGSAVFGCGCVSDVPYYCLTLKRPSGSGKMHLSD